MVTCISNSLGETEQLGKNWAGQFSPGWVIALIGDLGAGKTTLARGIARGLGYEGKVSSPTFGLVNIYQPGDLQIYHLDLYRLESQEQIVHAGLENYLISPNGISIVEWADRWDWPSGTEKLRKVWLKNLDEEIREISYEDSRA